MAVITFPTSLQVSKQTWGQQRQDVEFRSMFGAQSVAVASPLWSISMVVTDSLQANSGAWQSLLLQLRGRENQLAMYNIARPIPVGTMRGNMTFSAAAAQGATTFSVIASNMPAKTLLAGDFLGFGSGLTQQVVMVVANAVSDTTGTITVTVEPPLNNAFTSGSAVTWSYPCALFRRIESKSQWDYSSVVVSGMTMALLEDTRP